MKSPRTHAGICRQSDTLGLWDVFGENEPWSEWVKRWTAEEGRHAIGLRDYLTVT